MSDSETTLDELQIGPSIRNSLHSNGMYYGFKGRSKGYTIDGVSSDFKHGLEIDGGGWGHLYLACDNTLTIVESILMSPEVRAMTDPIKDEFAWGNAGLP